MASAGGRRQAAGAHRRARTGRVAGDGPPARLELRGGTDANATRACRDCYTSSCSAVSAAEGRRLRRGHPMGQRAASTRERLLHPRAGVQHAAKTRGAAHEQPRDALGGLGPRAAMPPHPCARGGETAGGAGDGCGAQAEDLATAAWRTRAGAMGGGLPKVSEAGDAAGGPPRA